MTMASGQSAWKIWVKFYMPEIDFQQTVAKVAIFFSSQITIFENTAFGQVIEVPTKLNKPAKKFFKKM